MQHATNKTEEKLLHLASLLNIPQEYGWITNLSKKLNIKRVLISTWIKRDNVPKKQRERIAAMGYPEDQWWSTPEPYEQDPEHMLPRTHDPDAGSYGGNLDLSGFRVTKTVEKDASDQEYINMVKDILKSPHTGVSGALKANIHQFHDQIEEKERIKHLERRVEELTDNLKKTKNSTGKPARTGNAPSE